MRPRHENPSPEVAYGREIKRIGRVVKRGYLRETELGRRDESLDSRVQGIAACIKAVQSFPDLSPDQRQELLSKILKKYSALAAVSTVQNAGPEQYQRGFYEQVLVSEEEKTRKAVIAYTNGESGSSK